MLLVVDVGNTRIDAGLASDGKIVRQEQFPSDGDLTVCFKNLIGEHALEDAAAVSVVPQLCDPVAEAVAAAARRVSLLWIPRDLPYPVPLDVEEPDRVGPDRVMIAAAVGARALPGAVVVDVGTAVTVEVIGARGAYRGGAIAVGPRMAARALHEHTALLPLVEPEVPTFALGRTTEGCIQSGLTYGIAGMIDRLVREITRSLRGKVPVLATGGGAALIAPLSETLGEVLPGLVLEGIVETYRAARGITWPTGIKEGFRV